MIRSAPLMPVCSRDLRALKRAGEELLGVMQELQDKGRNVLSELQPNEQGMQQWDHYPADDAFDPVSGYRWYYHAHPEHGRDAEHGHFHLFAAAPAKAGKGRYTHLLALAVSPAGLPLRMFTTNRWVTNEVLAPAGQVLRKLQQFALRTPSELELVHRWLAAVLGLFRPQINALLVARDQRLESAQALRPNVFEDRRTMLLSQCRIDLAQQMAWLDRASEKSVHTAQARDPDRRASLEAGRPRVRSFIALTGAVPQATSAGEPLRGTRGLHPALAGRPMAPSCGNTQHSNRNIPGDI